jgi:hypothetical protein
MQSKIVADLTDDSSWSLPVPELDNPEIFQSILEVLPTGGYLVDRNRTISRHPPVGARESILLPDGNPLRALCG